MSTKFTPAILIRTNALPGPGLGVSISRNFRTSGPPYCSTRMAFIDLPWENVIAPRARESSGLSGALVEPNGLCRDCMYGCGRSEIAFDLFERASLCLH